MSTSMSQNSSCSLTAWLQDVSSTMTEKPAVESAGLSASELLVKRHRGSLSLGALPKLQFGKWSGSEVSMTSIFPEPPSYTPSDGHTAEDRPAAPMTRALSHGSSDQQAARLSRWSFTTGESSSASLDAERPESCYEPTFGLVVGRGMAGLAAYRLDGFRVQARAESHGPLSPRSGNESMSAHHAELLSALQTISSAPVCLARSSSWSITSDKFVDALEHADDVPGTGKAVPVRLPKVRRKSSSAIAPSQRALVDSQTVSTTTTPSLQPESVFDRIASLHDRQSDRTSLSTTSSADFALQVATEEPGEEITVSTMPIGSSRLPRQRLSIKTSHDFAHINSPTKIESGWSTSIDDSITRSRLAEAALTRGLSISPEPFGWQPRSFELSPTRAVESMPSPGRVPTIPDRQPSLSCFVEHLEDVAPRESQCTTTASTEALSQDLALRRSLSKPGLFAARKPPPSIDVLLASSLYPSTQQARSPSPERRSSWESELIRTFEERISFIDGAEGFNLSPTSFVSARSDFWPADTSKPLPELPRDDDSARRSLSPRKVSFAVPMSKRGSQSCATSVSCEDGPTAVLAHLSHDSPSSSPTEQSHLKRATSLNRIKTTWLFKRKSAIGVISSLSDSSSASRRTPSLII
ncbi:uncharacterized protein L969DRAFT_93553 [Mixia osmundae IAM 14324]|uniref:Uncharacterized protein n=1 Tax=Mixia osmundae (strain CBS 9802 / IAM 14324 / JCM 22182 / KY 12970) TaxID=764103 RepID=G7DUB2_MIXOS|nr:uncharacterized protein L969DRAFT_93553 [Mixia osmundae IAM 14324]KEI41044.1 hypothetical protein L969DRAFT_93553 [Mixia osmundae IAM 14324]GAA94172.1 hypothetical protein E5Q_00820 [Mixia osmundae IAM 14324]